MKTSRLNYRKRRAQRGQSFLLIVMFIALLLLGILGIATDYSQIWAHRQMAQGAADAACQAAAADLYLAMQGTSYSWISSTTPFDCTSNTSSAPCQYASLNGYTGSQVNVSFPSSLPGVAALPPSVSVANAYVLVNISDSVTMGLSKLLNAGNNFTITAKAGCGLVEVTERIPLLILGRGNSTTFQTGGSSNITITGGPQRSIEVDANGTSAANIGGTVNLSTAGPSSTGGDFAVGGAEAKPGVPSPLNLGTSGNWVKSALPLPDPFASYAAPAQPTNKGAAFPVALGVNGCPDPTGCTEFTGGDYSSCSSANNQAVNANACPVAPNFAAPYGNPWIAVHGFSAGALIVPATGNSNHYMFMATQGGTSGASGSQPTWGTQALGSIFTDGSVKWQNMGPVNTSPTGANTAIFDPGVYYMGSSGLQPPSGTTVRTSTAAGDGTGGLTFYFSKSASVSIGSNTGAQSSCTSVTAGANSWAISPNKCIVQYNVDGSSTFGVASRTLKCASGSPPNPSGVLASYAGNILLGPCSGPSTADGQTTDYSGGIDTTDGFTGSSRGFLFFQSRTAAADGGSCTAGFTGKCAILGGGGSYIFSGFAYFHMNTGSTGTKCGTDISCLTYAGGAGSSSVTLGNIVIDQLSLTGTANLTMDLNSYTSFPVLKPSLLE